MIEESGFDIGDEKEITKVFADIVRYLRENDVRTVDGLSALLNIVILHSQNCGVLKPHLLCHVSNLWELLDPDNEHPIRKAYEESRGPSVKKIYSVRKVDPNFLPSKKPKESDRVED